MEIKTGYFAQSKKYIEAGYTVVGITRFPPKWFDGLNLIMFAPTSTLLKDYKNGDINWDTFSKQYLSYLSTLGSFTKNALFSLNDTYDKIVLCCFEKSDSPCHRHILAKYLNETFNFNIEEFIIGG